MSTTQVISASIPRKEKILLTLKNLVNDLTGMAPEEIDVNVHFLEVGIDSLTLIQATQLVKDNYEIKLSVVQLLEQLTTLDLLASYIDDQLPPEALAPPPAAVVTAAPSLNIAATIPDESPNGNPPAPDLQAMGGATTAASNSALEQIFARQLEVMSQQLQMLRRQGNGGGGAAVQSAASPSRQTVPPHAREEKSAPSAPAAVLPASKPNPAPYVPYQPVEPGTTGGLTRRQQQYLDDLIARHNARTRESKRLTQEYRPYFSDSRSTVGFRLLWKELVYPIIGQRSRGSKVWDVDGNEYVDVSMGFGVHLFGHSPDFIVEAMQKQIEGESLQLGPQSMLAGQVSQQFAEMTGQQRVNFCNSGTEAVMGALRIARTVTRRDKIAIFSGAYHGWSDTTLAKQLNVKGQQRYVPVAPGVAPKAVEDVVVLDWDSSASIDYLEQHAREFAAVMVEPVQSRRPDIQPREFLHELRRLTTKAGTAFIMDEMITGFRIHNGGAQAFFGVEADIATYGKVIGGGMPVGVIAGQAAYMDTFDGGMWDYGDASYPQAEKTVFAGAFFKHPLTMASAQAILHRLKGEPELLPQLNERTARLVAALNQYFTETQLPVTVVNFSSLFRFMFSPELKFVDLFFYHMLLNGIFIWEGRNCFLSTAHTEADLERILQAVRRSVEQMREGDFWPPAPERPTPDDGRSGAHADGRAPGAASSLASLNGGAASADAAPPSSIKGFAAATVESRAADVRVVEAQTAETQFSLYYFGSYASEFSTDKYELLIEGARFADRHGFAAVWVPERHFHAFGGISPNPSVVSAALARETERLQLRAGSVVLPLHNPVRVAEEWSVVDNLSRGRVGVSFASGWQPNDFVFAPDAFATRHEHMYRGIEVVRQLWRGEPIRVRSGNGKEISVKLAPMPMQRELPCWLTGASPASFAKAGELGLRLLTNLQDQSVEELAKKIAVYRDSLARHGFDAATGHVTLLLHTFIDEDLERAKEKARLPLYNYMRSSLGLMSNKVRGRQSREIDLKELTPEDMEYILAGGYERYVESASLIGTPDSCAATIDKLKGAGVNEFASLIDFGVETRSVLDSLPLLDRLKERHRVCPRPAAESRPTINLAASDEALTIPLTDAQRQLWIATQIGEDASRAYNEAATFKLAGPFDPEAMRRALRRLVARHDQLRATFGPEGDRQRILPAVELDIPLVDFSHVEETSRERAALAWIAAEMGKPYDLARGPLVRFRFARLGAQNHLLMLGNHHLVVDGQSFGVLVSELKALYTAEREGTPAALPPPRSFREFTDKLERLQRRPEMQAAETYWLEQFADSVPVLELPTDFARPPVQTYNGKRLLIPTGPALFSDIKKLCVEKGSTVYMMLLAGYNILMHRLSGQERLIVGVPAAGQMSVGSKDVVGYCVNLLPLLSATAENPTFADYLAAVKRRLMESYEHQHYSFGTLLKQLNVPWDSSRVPLFTTIFNVDRTGPVVKFCDLELQAVANSTDMARYDLRMNVVETEEELLFECTYNTDLFKEETVRRWMEHFQTLLHALVARPEERVWHLPLLSEDERRRLLAEPAAEGAESAPPRLFPALFEEQAARTPESLALVYEDERISYGELNERANRLAHYLRRRDAGRETPVAICLGRSAAMLTAMLAVLKTGAAYVPLDPTYPTERLRYVASDCGARIVLTEEARRETWEGHAATVVCLDTEWKEVERERAENLPSHPEPENLAYVIYTSGSTGRPKGVGVEHRQLANYLQGVSARLSLPPGGSYATVSTLAADLGNTMIFPALAMGGQLHVLSEERITNPDALADYFAQHGIDCLKIVPSHLEALLTARHPAEVLPRKRLILGGEASRPALLERLRALAPTCEIFNHYGPTETTIGVLTHHAEAPASLALPLGRPLPRTRVYVLDAYMEPVSEGVRGEIYIGGKAVSRGYLQRPGLTAAVFLPDPFAREPGSRLYRTGDLARLLADGSIEFVGRRDEQVKIRGLRVELGEIEAALAAHEAVREVLVTLREDAPGDKRLVAYVVGADGGAAVAPDELRRQLRRRLPEHLVPAAFVMLDQMPLTPNGKLDRRALPPPGDARSATDAPFVGPRNALEQELAAMWSEVLRLKQACVEDNFFDLGGNSLLATQITARVRDRMQVELTLRNMFEAPTIAGLALLIAERRGARNGADAGAQEPVDGALAQLALRVDELDDDEVDSLLDGLLAGEEAV